jgi:protoheme IX farnesyltransferase
VVAGPEETKRQILLHSLAMVACTVALGIVAETGAFYLAVAAMLGAGFLYLAVRLWRDSSARAASALFRYSIVYLGLLFGAIAVEGLL